MSEFAATFPQILTLASQKHRSNRHSFESEDFYFLEIAPLFIMADSLLGSCHSQFLARASKEKESWEGG